MFCIKCGKALSGMGKCPACGTLNSISSRNNYMKAPEIAELLNSDSDLCEVCRTESPSAADVREVPVNEPEAPSAETKKELLPEPRSIPAAKADIPDTSEKTAQKKRRRLSTRGIVVICSAAMILVLAGIIALLCISRKDDDSSDNGGTDSTESSTAVSTEAPTEGTSEAVPEIPVETTFKLPFDYVVKGYTIPAALNNYIAKNYRNMVTPDISGLTPEMTFDEQYTYDNTDCVLIENSSQKKSKLHYFTHQNTMGKQYIAEPFMPSDPPFVVYIEPTIRNGEYYMGVYRNGSASYYYVRDNNIYRLPDKLVQ